MVVVDKEVLLLNKLTKDFKFRFFDIWSVQQTSGLQWIRQVLYTVEIARGKDMTRSTEMHALFQYKNRYIKKSRLGLCKT